MHLGAQDFILEIGTEDPYYTIVVKTSIRHLIIC